MQNQINQRLLVALAKAQHDVENASKKCQNPISSLSIDLAELLNTVRPIFSSRVSHYCKMPSFDNEQA